jgi:hypothetical protein
MPNSPSDGASASGAIDFDRDLLRALREPPQQLRQRGQIRPLADEKEDRLEIARHIFETKHDRRLRTFDP